MAARVALSGWAFFTALTCAPAFAADARHGDIVARRWCAGCHLVTPGQTEAKADAPPFSVVAKTRTAATLRLFLADPYPRMPNMSLSRDEIADLVAFIKTYGLAPDEKPEPAVPPETDTPGRDHRG